MVLMHGSHAVKCASTLQDVIAFEDLGLSVALVLLTDSNAAKGVSAALVWAPAGT